MTDNTPRTQKLTEQGENPRPAKPKQPTPSPRLMRGKIYDYEARFHDEKFIDDHKELIIPDHRSEL